MDSDIIESVTGWTTVPSGTGYAGLHRLADEGFSGAVTANGAWAFALNGRIVGVFDGSIGTFEGADLTAHEAPDRSLPLLYAMQERGGEMRAKYYTNDTPLSDADETLSEGNFTGYVELSENVLSGDYYVVYYGGRSMSAAFLGNSRRLVTGEEAFERANDEVGIYEVRESPVDVVEIPEPADGTESEATEGVQESPGVGAADDREADPAATSGVDDAGFGSGEPTGADTAGEGTDAGVDEIREADERRRNDERSEPEPEAGVAEPAAAADEDEGTTGDGPTAADAGTDTDSTARASSGASGPGRAGTDADEGTDDPGTTADADVDDASPPSGPGAAGSESERAGGEDGSDSAADDDVFSEEERWREARAIPALDPENSTEADGLTRRGRRRGAQSPPEAREEVGNAESPADEGGSSERRREPSSSPSPDTSGRADPDGDRTASAKQLAEARAARDRLAAERDELREDRDEYRDEVERLRSRIAKLESEVERLESELKAAGAETGGGARTGRRTMDSEAALAGTNLFIRYRQKGEATLEEAHAGRAERGEVNENLRVEHHAEFDTDGLTVDGRPYEEFLEDSLEYGFVEWLVTDLPYEIRETGNRGTLDDLYDVIPSMDRVELRGSVPITVWDDEESEEVDGQRTFDVVIRDGRGDPLVVANLNADREAATEEMVSSLAADARDIADQADSLGAAFFVTASFFEPAALDIVTGETGGGLLSRTKRKSFVKLSRKRGFHLCLVEGRGGDFHVNVPDL